MAAAQARAQELRVSSPAALTDCLGCHPWLAGAHVGRTGVLLLLSADGHVALHRQGRRSLLENLCAHLREHAIDPPRDWRLLDTAPGELDPQAIDSLLAAPRPDRVITQTEHEQDGRWTLTLRLPLELVHFDGHFPQAPVLPGVMQVGWALALAAPRLGTSMHCQQMEALKFQRLLRPGDQVELSLHVDDERDDSGRCKLHFAYHLDGAHCSSGRLRVSRA
jgi:3-hydroxymyristoyl/3-hydroxydecanoyl-(acyl carrier protein) dehydratase